MKSVGLFFDLIQGSPSSLLKLKSIIRWKSQRSCTSDFTAVQQTSQKETDLGGNPLEDASPSGDLIHRVNGFSRRAEGSAHMDTKCVLFLIISSMACGCGFVLRPTLQGSGNSATQIREVSSFDRVELDGIFDTTISIGAEQSVTITADDNLIEIVRTSVSGGELQIDTTGSFGTKIGMQVAIVMPVLVACQKNGTGSLQIIDFQGEELEISQFGMGDISVRGSVGIVQASTHGIGSIELTELIAREAIVATHGIGDIEVYATNKISAEINGIGTITVHGDPEERSSRINGIGDLIFD